MTVADKIAEWLHEKGINTAYGIIGAGNLALFNSIARLGKTQIVCVHHEQAAAMSSSFHNRAVGGISSIALVTTGGGSTNALTGVMAAYMDRVPLLVISGNEPSKHFRHLKTYRLRQESRVQGVQGYPSAHVAESFTKSAWQADSAERVMEELKWRADLALTPPCGPVWVDIPKDIQNATP